MRTEVQQLIAKMKESGLQERHDTPSGSVLAQQEGATTRAGMVDRRPRIHTTELRSIRSCPRQR
jgi:hypothetical protein